MTETPEVEIFKTTIEAVQVVGPFSELFQNAGVTIFEVACTGDECSYRDESNDQDTALEMRDKHVDWHENGMPE